MLKRIVAFILLPGLLIGCDKIKQTAEHIFTHASVEPSAVMQVEGQTLYLDHLKSVIPDGLTGQDSVEFVQNYMRQWATTQLMYSKAIQNVNTTTEIDEMAETYRRELIVNAYQQQLVVQKIAPIPEDSLRNFYEREKKHFPMEGTIIKGIFIKIPTRAPHQSKLSQWLRSMDDEDLEKISTYCDQHAVAQEMFLENWTPYNKIISLLPDYVSPDDARLQQSTLVEQSEDFSYYLRITEMVKDGQPRPYELARGDVEYTLTNRQKLEISRIFRTNSTGKPSKTGKSNS